MLFIFTCFSWEEKTWYYVCGGLGGGSFLLLSTVIVIAYRRRHRFRPWLASQCLRITSRLVRHRNHPAPGTNPPVIENIPPQIENPYELTPHRPEREPQPLPAIPEAIEIPTYNLRRNRRPPQRYGYEEGGTLV